MSGPRRAVRSGSKRKRRAAFLTQDDYDYACSRAAALGLSFSLWMEILVHNHRKNYVPAPPVTEIRRPL